MDIKLQKLQIFRIEGNTKTGFLIKTTAKLEMILINKDNQEEVALVEDSLTKEEEEDSEMDKLKLNFLDFKAEMNIKEEEEEEILEETSKEEGVQCKFSYLNIFRNLRGTNFDSSRG